MSEEKLHKYKTKQEVMANDIKNIKDNIDDIKVYVQEDRQWKQNIEDKYARKEELRSLKSVVYGIIYTFILTGIGALGYLLTNYF